MRVKGQLIYAGRCRRGGKLERVHPAPVSAVAGVREKASTYRKKKAARK